MADDIGGVWRTIGGRRVFIKDGEDLETAMKKSGKFKSVKKGKKDVDTQKYGKDIRKAIKEIDSDKYEDGTYHFGDKKAVEFENGYQATFQQMGDKYTDKEFGDLAKYYADKTDGNAYIGKYEGSPEVSFHFKTEKEAIEICKKYNQVSYWDWKNMKEVKNRYYKEGRGNDYAKRR